jgi:shikimate kinase
VLGSTTARDTRLVLALGGGTFAQPRNAALIRESGANPRGSASAVIWLDCPADELLQRCVLMGDRPLFRDEASFRKLYEERLPHYRQADYRVESGGEPLRVVERILALGIFGRVVPSHAGGNVPGAPAS